MGLQAHFNLIKANNLIIETLIVLTNRWDYLDSTN